MNFLPRIRQVLRKQKDSANPLIRVSVRTLHSAVRVPSRVKALVSDGDYRAVALMKALRGRTLHQTTAMTWLNRYPAIFGACRTYFEEHRDLKILSYGCSTGEEVVTLREYFPSARIVGAEINPRSLAICRGLKVDERISFCDSKGKLMEGEAPFDAVFCMAVLQRTPHWVEETGARSLARLYPFEKFDAQVSALDRLLAPQGLLVIHHTQYVFKDASVASKYMPLAAQPAPTPDGPRFGRDSALIERQVTTPSVYVKQRM